MRQPEEREILEPEVLPPAGKTPPPRDPIKDWFHTIGPIMLGVVIDLVDLATFGPIGLRLGFPFGFLAAWLMCTMYRLPLSFKFPVSIAAGFYCMIPGTELIPLGTILGALAVFRRSR